MSELKMRIRLRAKYSFTFILLILLIILVMAGTLLYRLNSSLSALTAASSKVMAQELLQQMQKRGEVIVQNLSENLVNPLYRYDIETIYELLLTAKQQEDVLFAVVYDGNGAIIQDGTKGVPEYGKLLNNDEARSAIFFKGKIVAKNLDHILDVSIPIWIGDSPLGGVSVGLSLNSVADDIGNMEEVLNRLKQTKLSRNFVFVGITTLALVVFGFVLSVFVSSRLIRPIRELSEYAAKLGKGTYDFKIPLKYRDEIGDLFQSFSKMKSDLEKTTVSIDVLEKKVDDRTEALRASNDKLLAEVVIRKDAENALTQHQEGLEELIDERTEQLVRSNEQLKNEIKDREQAERGQEKAVARLQRAQKMEAIGTLAGGVAHDLNNILSGIVSYPELLLLDLEKDSPLKDSLERIHESGKKAADIVQDLLTLARRGVSVQEVIDLNHIIEKFISSPEFIKLHTIHPGVFVEKRLSPDLSRIIGSPVHLSKTVMNLVFNAMEAMPKGGKVTIATENRYLSEPVNGHEDIVEGDYVLFSIADEGAGIAPEDLEYIYEPFFTRKKMGRSGTGLGMAVVWGTVTDLNGYIEVQSTIGEQTKFTLYLPATKHEVEEEVGPVQLDKIKGRGTVLVVDDIQNQRDIAQSILSKLGYVVTTVSSGENAVDYLRQNATDLVLLDMIMAPGIDGLETYKRILGIHPNQKVVIASGYSETGRVREAMDLGVGAYIQKPYTIEELGKMVKSSLNC